MIAYASRTGTKRNLAVLREAGWRLLISATGCHRTEGFRYALDNGAWTAWQRKEAWNEARFRLLVERLGAGADWVVAPDIVMGGGESLKHSLAWLPWCLERCTVVLLAVQDGMTADDVTPYLGPRVGVFVGGGTEWKVTTLRWWPAVAHARGAICHVGRVNSARRITSCAIAGVDSFDGTSASRYALTLPRLDQAMRQGALLL